MKKFGRILTLVLTAATLISSAVLPAAALPDATGGSMSNIAYTADYTAGQFADVDESKWYGEGGQQVIGNACRLALMKGTNSGFSPSGAVTLAEAVTMAARLNNLYYGGVVTFKQGQPWYGVYVTYAVNNGIIGSDDFSGNYTRAATRAEMAYVFANALPDVEFVAINTITAIPDVDSKTDYTDNIFRLYRAGVLTGDDTGAFRPESGIDRASAAAIIARVALPQTRKTFTLDTQSTATRWDDVYTPDMWIDTLDAMNAIYAAAVLNRIDSFQVRISRDLADAFYDKGVSFDFNVSKIRYEYGGYVPNRLRLSISYTIFGEVEALGISADAEKRASDEALAYSTKINAIKNSLITGNMTDREKCRAIHDFMVRNYSYDQNCSEGSYSFTNLLDYNTAVCQGYMQLFYLLATRSGVYCEMVTGTADGTGDGLYGPHGWNRVYVDGAWYHIDVTFDDPIGGTWDVDHQYFLLTDNQIAADHKW